MDNEAAKRFLEDNKIKTVQEAENELKRLNNQRISDRAVKKMNNKDLEYQENKTIKESNLDKYSIVSKEIENRALKGKYSQYGIEKDRNNELKQKIAKQQAKKKKK